MEFATENQKWAAFLGRDEQADGKFFAGVLTTGVFCRSICAGRPLRKNVRFFNTIIDAQQSGLRACKLCKPLKYSFEPLK